MSKLNCWEHQKCGREPGGDRVEELSVCPAAISGAHDGVNNGQFAGRFCWTINATLCNDEIQGPLKNKLNNCLQCSFLKKINEEEGRDFVLIPTMRKRDFPK